jgi:hypothetical protein
MAVYALISKSLDMKRLAANKIRTIDGRSLMVSFLDQVAIGIYEPESVVSTIPKTFALYKVHGKIFVLEITTYQQEDDDLVTTYQVLPETEAEKFIATDRTGSLAY